MNRRQYLGYGAGALSLIMCGCSTEPGNAPVSVSLYGEKGKTPADVALNPITVTDSQFKLEGRLTAGGGTLNKDLYRDVSIQLYSGSGQAHCSHLIGDWEGDTRPVSFSTDVIPTYVILYSPDFWDEPMEVDYFVYEKEEGLFVPEEAATRNELPVDEIQTGLSSCTK